MLKCNYKFFKIWIFKAKKNYCNFRSEWLSITFLKIKKMLRYDVYIIFLYRNLQFFSFKRTFFLFYFLLNIAHALCMIIFFFFRLTMVNVALIPKIAVYRKYMNHISVGLLLFSGDIIDMTIISHYVTSSTQRVVRHIEESGQ